MSRDEFLYEHDLIDISTMINTLFKDSKKEKEQTPKEMRAVDVL